MRRWAGLTLWLLLGAWGALAQSRPITLDDVNEVASRIYCPVCENIPLDDCGTTTCIEWKIEIEQLLREGQSPDDIIASFVNRYGQHVVGIPQDGTLRLLSLLMPLLLVIGAGFVAWRTTQDWQKRKNAPLASATATPDGATAYRDQIEQDLG